MWNLEPEKQKSAVVTALCWWMDGDPADVRGSTGAFLRRKRWRVRRT